MNKKKKALNGGRLAAVRAVSWLGLCALIYGTWKITRLGWYKSGDDVGYGMGVVGAVMMLLLFAYPLRKHVKWMQGFGQMKHWFITHMVLGLGGPLVVLAHTNFELRSMNATVAVWSMIVVVASGLLGRFVYLQVNQGLGGHRESAESLARLIDEEKRSGESLSRLAPKMIAQLAEHGRRVDEHSAKEGALARAWSVFGLPFECIATIERCRAKLREDLQGELGRLPAGEREKARVKMLDFAKQYVEATRRVAAFAAYSKLFSLWHILHVPFVFMMVVCVLVHIAAVHIY